MPFHQFADAVEKEQPRVLLEVGVAPEPRLIHGAEDRQGEEQGVEFGEAELQRVEEEPDKHCGDHHERQKAKEHPQQLDERGGEQEAGERKGKEHGEVNDGRNLRLAQREEVVLAEAGGAHVEKLPLADDAEVFARVGEQPRLAVFHPQQLHAGPLLRPDGPLDFGVEVLGGEVHLRRHAAPVGEHLGLAGVELSGGQVQGDVEAPSAGANDEARSKQQGEPGAPVYAEESGKGWQRWFLQDPARIAFIVCALGIIGCYFAPWITIQETETFSGYGIFRLDRKLALLPPGLAVAALLVNGNPGARRRVGLLTALLSWFIIYWFANKTTE